MARLIVDSVVASGFVRYSEDHPGTLRLGGRGPVILAGANGVGKSTIASKAVSWALYGKCAPERMGAATQSLKGRSVVADGCTTATVTVELRDPHDGSGYVIERTRTRTKSDAVTVLRVEADGTRAPVEAATQATIASIIGCDHAVFCATVLRGQGDPWNFAEATDKGKREIMAAVSGADKLADYHKASRDLHNALLRDVEALRTRAGDADHRADRIDLEAMRRQVDAWEQEQADRITRAITEVEHLQDQERTARAADEAAAKAQAARTAHAATKPVLDRTPYTLSVDQHEAALQAVIAEHSAAKAAWESVEHLGHGDDCPTCGQVIAPTAPVAAKRASAQPKFVAAEEARTRAVAAYDAARDAARAADRWLGEEIAKWEAAGAALGDGLIGRLTAAQTATNIAKRRLTDLRSGDNPHRAVLARAERDKRDLTREAMMLRAAAALAAQDCRLAAATMAVLSPRGAPAIMAEDVLVTIEVNANRWLDILSEGRMVVEFRPGTGDAIQTIITTTDTPKGAGPVERDLLMLSGGERARINLAVDLGVAAAFSATDGLPLSLLVLDEGVFSGVDNAGKTAIVQTLLLAGVSDIVVIDHDPAARGRLDREVVVSRRPDGYATITETTS